MRICNDDFCVNIMNGGNEVGRANTLFSVVKDISKLVKYMATKCMNHENPKIRAIARNLAERYNPNNFNEGLQTYIDDKKYVYMCIESQRNNMMFAALHELSHMASDKYGHGTEFWSTFKKVLTVSVKLGIYEPVDYGRLNNGMQFCGVTVRYNPYYDDELS